MVEDFGVGLADSARLKHNEVVLGGLEDAERITHVLAQRQIALTRRERTHVYVGVVDRVHANPVAQKCSASFALGGIHAH